MSILLPLFVALPVTFCTIIIHALAVGAIVRFVRREQRLGHAGVWFWTDVAIVAGAALLALTAHLVEITVWAAVFVGCGEFSRLAPAFYHSAVNYTSLGYGDVIMSPSWRLLGPLETADGMLMFGVSTAMIFAAIQRLVQTRFQTVRN
jgi:Ion channel